MKVICKTKNLNNLIDKIVLDRLKKYISITDEEDMLEAGREYTVYGIIFRDNAPWYYLCAEEDENYPVPFAAEFFKVSDDRLSSYWKLSVDDRDPEKVLSSLLFAEWAQENPFFYECLLDGYPEAIELFMRYRRLMDQE